MLRLVLYIVYVDYRKELSQKIFKCIHILDTVEPNTDLVISKLMGVNRIVIVECG